MALVSTPGKTRFFVSGFAWLDAASVAPVAVALLALESRQPAAAALPMSPSKTKLTIWSPCRKAHVH
jgi:hypothetical protein